MKALSENGSYCVQFIRNSGDRTRAVRLYMELTGTNGIEASRAVMNLKTKVPLSTNRSRMKHCDVCGNDWHVDTVSCPICFVTVPFKKEETR